MEQTFSVKEESCPTAKDLCLSSIFSYPYFHFFWAVVAWILVATSILFPLCYALQLFGIICFNSKNNKKKEIKTDERGTCMVEMVYTHMRSKAVVGRVHILAINLSHLCHLLLKSVSVAGAYVTRQACRASVPGRCPSCRISISSPAPSCWNITCAQKSGSAIWVERGPCLTELGGAQAGSEWDLMW